MVRPTPLYSSGELIETNLRVRNTSNRQPQWAEPDQFSLRLRNPESGFARSPVPPNRIPRPFPVTEDMVVTAILHDAVEDRGGTARLQDIRANFGAEVARMVEGCSDSFAENSADKEPWEQRKRAYLERLRKEPLDTLLISAADKLYNARAILDDYRLIKSDIWKRFKRSRNEQLWYFNELLDAYGSSGSNRIVEELQRVVTELTRVSGHDPLSPVDG
jgi:hypothetical protein